MPGEVSEIKLTHRLHFMSFATELPHCLQLIFLVFSWERKIWPEHRKFHFCSGSAGGRWPHQGLGGAGAQFQNSSVAKQGDYGSNLPAMPSQATVKAGELLKVGWTVRDRAHKNTAPLS